MRELEKLTSKDCVNRVYQDKTLARFDVLIADEDNEAAYEFRFYRLDAAEPNESNGGTWKIQAIEDNDKTGVLSPCVVEASYEVPSRRASLEFIASVGLRHVMHAYVESAARASGLSFLLSEVCL